MINYFKIGYYKRKFFSQVADFNLTVSSTAVPYHKRGFPEKSETRWETAQIGPIKEHGV